MAAICVVFSHSAVIPNNEEWAADIGVPGYASPTEDLRFFSISLTVGASRFYRGTDELASPVIWRRFPDFLY